MELLKVLITVKTYPIPSKQHDELVCTAGVTEAGNFVRLYPINFRDLPFSQQYQKYQWIEVMAEKHGGRDSRKESYRPDCDTLQVIGEPIGTDAGSWASRGKFVLRSEARSMEELRELQGSDRTSLGIFRPKEVKRIIVTRDSPTWPPKFLQELKQARLWESRQTTQEPPRKVPFKFQYVFTCDDSRCTGHKMMNEDWEVGALYWKLVDRGDAPEAAAEQVRAKFLNELCGPTRDTRFFVGTILKHPKSWVVIGVYWPRMAAGSGSNEGPLLFA